MPGYSDVTDDEVKSRLDTVLERLDRNLKQVAPTLNNIAKDRIEAANLVEELKKRGLWQETGKDAVPKV